MPVPAVLSPTPPVTGAGSADPSATPAAPGFATALAGASAAPAAAPAAPLSAHRSIGLAEMLSVRAGTAATTTLPGAASPMGAAAAGAAGAPTAPSSGSSDAVIAAGERYLGVPYKWGGTDPATGLDCSGFVQRVFKDLGVDLPRVSVDQARAGQPVASLDQAVPGDLVFWRGDGSRPNHIGIYAGEGRMLVAPRTGDVVKYQDISRTPHEIRRVI